KSPSSERPRIAACSNPLQVRIARLNGKGGSVTPRAVYSFLRSSCLTSAARRGDESCARSRPSWWWFHWCGQEASCLAAYAAAPPPWLPIRDALVPRAIGQSFDRFVAAEAEVRGARAADRPAALPLTELEQRAAAPIEDRDILGLWFRERRLKHL